MTERRSVRFQASGQTSIELDTIPEAEEKEPLEEGKEPVGPGELRIGSNWWLANAIQEGNDKAIESWLDDGITEENGGQKSLRQSLV